MKSGSNEGDVWIPDSGASLHMTHDTTILYALRFPPPGLKTITIGNRRKIKLECVGNVDVISHGFKDERITLIDVSYVPGLVFNQPSLHAVYKTHLIVSDASGVPPQK